MSNVFLVHFVSDQLKTLIQSFCNVHYALFYISFNHRLCGYSKRNAQSDQESEHHVPHPERIQ